jgi:hypothetical protein
MALPEQQDLTSDINAETAALEEEMSANEADAAAMAEAMPEVAVGATRRPASLEVNRIADLLEQSKDIASPREANMLIPMAAAAQQIGQAMAGRYSGNFKADNSVLKLLQEEQDREARNRQEQLRNLLTTYRQLNPVERFQQSVYMTEDDKPLIYSNLTGKYTLPDGTEYNGKVKVRTSPFQEAVTNLRINEFDQRKKEEARRTEASERKERIDKLTAARNLLKDDPRVKKSIDQAMAFENVTGLLENARSNNELAIPALGTQLARAMGEVGVLTDTDVTRYLGGPAWMTQLSSWYKKGAEGELPKSVLDQLEKNAEKLQKAIDKRINDVYANAENRMAVTFPEMDRKEIQGLLGRPTLKSEDKKVPPVGTIINAKGKRFQVINEKGDLKEIK